MTRAGRSVPDPRSTPPGPRRRAARRCAALWIGLALALGCPARQPGVAVVASVYPLELLLRELGAQQLGVGTLVPPGASPHTFEPLPQDLARLAGARAFVRVGGAFDDWSTRLLAAASEPLRVLTVLELEGLAPLPTSGSEPGHLATGAPDPHVWLDPIRVRDVIAPALTGLLIELAPRQQAELRERLTAFQARLTRLDAEIRELLTSAPARRYLAFHGAWRYFAARYALEEVAVVHQFPGEEPTPRELAELLQRARVAAVPAILVEPQLPSRVAEVLAAELGGRTVQADPLGDPRDPERASYESLLRSAARAFARALAGGGA